MPNPRDADKLQYSKADGRYFTTVYPPAGKPQRVYLGKERRDAVGMLEGIEKPLKAGDVGEVKRRVAHFKKIIDRLGGLPVAAVEVFTLGGHLVPSADGEAVNLAEGDYPERLQELIDYAEAHDSSGYRILRPTWRHCETCDAPYPLVDTTLEIFHTLAEQERLEEIGGYAAHAMDILADHKDTERLRALYDCVAELLGLKKRSKPPSEEKLSDCLREWQKRQPKKHTQHFNFYTHRFEDFIKHWGDIPISHLKKEHLTDYEAHISEAKADKTKKTRDDSIRPITAILSFVKRKTSYPFPDGLTDWTHSIDFGGYRPNPEKNLKRMPVEEFKKLLAKADEWANIDVEKFAKKVKYKGLNPKMTHARKYRLATQRKRLGLQWAVMIRLAAQCGYGPTDLASLCLDHLHLDGEVPYVELPRQKPEHLVGFPIPRKTPLLPATVKAMKQLAEQDPRPRETVFLSEKNAPFTPSGITQGYQLLAKAAEVAWELRFCRKIGPTLGFANRISREVRDVFLGHIVGDSTSRFYEEVATLGEGYLLPIVNLIGAEYFDGEEVSPHGLRVHGHQGA